MQRLELRDRASREGWIDSERFTEALRALDGDVANLREEIGVDAYDRFLYQTGQSNRVRIASVISESPAQAAGIEAGDVVIDYAGTRVFSFRDLRTASRAGERGEPVSLRVRRDGELVELVLPRGPLGIRMAADQADPDARS
jgi:S1-C subfamily serine protease